MNGAGWLGRGWAARPDGTAVLECGQSLAARAARRETFPIGAAKIAGKGHFASLRPNPMKKWVFPAAVLAIGVGLQGCPIYDQDDAGCYYDSDCAPGYSCDDSGSCYQPESDACRRPTDCGANETCSRSGTCVVGDCHFESVGCIRGYECSSASGRWECVEPEDEATGGSGSGGSSSDAGAPSTAGAPSSAGAPGAGGDTNGAAGQTGSAGAG